MNWKARLYIKEREHINIKLYPQTYVSDQRYTSIRNINFNNWHDIDGIVNYSTAGISQNINFIAIQMGGVGLSFWPGANISSSGTAPGALSALIVYTGIIPMGTVLSGVMPYLNVLVKHPK